MSGIQPQRGEVYSIINGYRVKIEHHQNASGKWQLGFTYQSNDEDLAIKNAITHTLNYVNGMKEAGLPPVDIKDKIQKEKKEVKEENG